MTPRAKIIESYGTVLEMLANGVLSGSTGIRLERVSSLLPGFRVEKDRIFLFGTEFNKDNLIYASMTGDSYEAESLIKGKDAIPKEVTVEYVLNYLDNLDTPFRYQRDFCQELKNRLMESD